MGRHTVLPLSSEVLGFAEIISSRAELTESNDKSSEPALFQTDIMNRLSTPWPVCLTRAEQLAERRGRARKLENGKTGRQGRERENWKTGKRERAGD